MAKEQAKPNASTAPRKSVEPQADATKERVVLNSASVQPSIIRGAKIRIYFKSAG